MTTIAVLSEYGFSIISDSHCSAFGLLEQLVALDCIEEGDRIPARTVVRHFKEVSVCRDQWMAVTVSVFYL